MPAAADAPGLPASACKPRACLTFAAPRCQTGGVGRALLVLVLLTLAGCERGPRYCLFDGTFIGAAPLPYVGMNPDGTVDSTPSRYEWREFVWPTDPQWLRVRPQGNAWLFEGTTGGRPWSFSGSFSGDGGADFVQSMVQGTPPAVTVLGSGGKPTLLVYRLKPCRTFEGSSSGVRTCTQWGAEVNARTRLTCE